MIILSLLLAVWRPAAAYEVEPEAEPAPLLGSTTSQAELDPELRDIYRIFQSARKLGAGRFKRIIGDYRKISEESEAEVRESLSRQMELDALAEKYRAAKDDGQKKELRKKAGDLLQKAFDEQLRRQADKARMFRQEAQRLDEDAAKRKQRRTELIQRKLDEALSEGANDWEL